MRGNWFGGTLSENCRIPLMGHSGFSVEHIHVFIKEPVGDIEADLLECRLFEDEAPVVVSGKEPACIFVSSLERHP